MGAVLWSSLTKWHPFIPATSSLGMSVYPRWLSFALFFFRFWQEKTRDMKHFPIFFLHLWQILWRREDGEGRCAFFLQLPSNQNKTAALHLRDHLRLKDLNSRGAIFEAPKMNVRKGHQMCRSIMHAQPAKPCSQHLISCVCYLLSFSLFHLLDREWECIVIYRILRDFDDIQLHPFIHFKPADISG